LVLGEMVLGYFGFVFTSFLWVKCPWHLLGVTKKVSARRQNRGTRSVIQGICIHH